MRNAAGLHSPTYSLSSPLTAVKVVPPPLLCPDNAGKKKEEGRKGPTGKVQGEVGSRRGARRRREKNAS